MRRFLTTSYSHPQIERSRVFDGRVWQPPPQWVIEAGALSISNAKFASLATSAGQCTYQIQVPSTSVYLDRLLNWSATVCVQFTVSLGDALQVPPNPYPNIAAASLFPIPYPIAQPGLDFSLCPSPLHALVTSLQASIGDTQVTNNLSQTRELLALLSDSSSNRKERTYPAMLDVYQSYIESAGAINDPMAGFTSSTTGGTEPNGSWPIEFLNPITGASLGGQTALFAVDTQGNWAFIASPIPALPYVPAGAFAAAGATYDIVGFYPTQSPVVLGTYQFNAANPPVQVLPARLAAPAYTLKWSFSTIEPLQVSPFLWQETHERQTGLAQLQNVQIICNMQTPAQARLVRWRPNGNNQGRYISQIGYAQIVGSPSPFQDTKIEALFLTPPIELMPLPEINTVDYQQVTSYPFAGVTLAGSSAVVQSQTLSLPIIPDYMVVAVVPQYNYYAGGAYPYAQCEGTWYLPITNCSLTWSNVSGLLSSMSQSQLFNMSKANGLEMTWAQWRGYANTANALTAIAAKAPQPAQGLPAFPAYTGAIGGNSTLTGGPLVLRPGKDITLETGTASGMSAGQWTAQFSLTVDLTNLTDAQKNALSVNQSCSIVVLAINGGFFATRAGSSRVIVGPVPAGTVVKAPLDKAEASASATGDRMVGAGAHKRPRGMEGRIK